MSNQHYFALLPATCLCLVLPACGGNSAKHVSPGEQPLLQIEEALGSYPVPKGVEPSLWRELTLALRDSIVEHGTWRAASMPPINEANKVNDLTAAVLPGGEIQLAWTYKNIGDYDYNSEVNIADLTLIGHFLGAVDSDTDWPDAHAADGDANGEVNIADITPIGQNFHNAISGFIVEGTDTPEAAESWVELADVSFADAKASSGIQMGSKLVIKTAGLHDEVRLEFDLGVSIYYRIKPYLLDNGDRVPGIASNTAERGASGSPFWNQAGGNASHTGRINVQSTDSGMLAEQVMFSYHFNTRPFVFDDGSFLVGGKNGYVGRYSAGFEQLWETNVGSPVNGVLDMGGGGASVFAGTDAGATFLHEDGFVQFSFDDVGAVVSEPVLHNVDGITAEYVFGTKLGWMVSYQYQFGPDLNWRVKFDGEIIDTPVPILGRNFFVTKDPLTSQSTIHSVDDDGQDEQVVSANIDYRVTLRSGLSDTFWANHGTSMQQYNADGSEGTRIDLNSGRFTAFDVFGSHLLFGFHDDEVEPEENTVVQYDVNLATKLWENPVLGRVTYVDDEGADNFAASKDGMLTNFDDDGNVKWQISILRPTARATDGSFPLRMSFVLSALYLADQYSVTRRDTETGSVVGSVDVANVLKTKLSPVFTSPGLALAILGFTAHTNLDGLGFDLTLRGMDNDLLRPYGAAATSDSYILSYGASYGGFKWGSSLPFGAGSQRSVSELGCSEVAMFATDGALGWRVPFTQESLTAPNYANGVIYIGGANGEEAGTGVLFALDEADGSEIWQASLDAPAIRIPVVNASGWVFVADDADMIHAFDAQGSPQWSEAHAAVSTGLVASPGGALYYGGTDGMVYAVDAATGGLLWSADTLDSIRVSMPAISASGKLRFGNMAGDLLEIDTNAPTPAASVIYSAGSPITRQPVIDSSGKTTFSTRDGRIICIGSDGSELWSYDTGAPASHYLSIGPNGLIYAANRFGNMVVIGE